MTKPRLTDYLSQVLVAIERIGEYIEDLDKAAFLADERTQDAVIRNLEIIGEASHRIETTSPQFVVDHPELPVSSAHQMRNAVVHGYFQVDLDIVWTTITRDLPPLAALVRTLIVEQR